jgi:hypothetical protein
MLAWTSAAGTDVPSKSSRPIEDTSLCSTSNGFILLRRITVEPPLPSKSLILTGASSLVSLGAIYHAVKVRGHSPVRPQGSLQPFVSASSLSLLFLGSMPGATAESPRENRKWIRRWLKPQNAAPSGRDTALSKDFLVSCNVTGALGVHGISCDLQYSQGPMGTMASMVVIIVSIVSTLLILRQGGKHDVQVYPPALGRVGSSSTVDNAKTFAPIPAVDIASAHPSPPPTPPPSPPSAPVPSSSFARPPRVMLMRLEEEEPLTAAAPQAAPIVETPRRSSEAPRRSSGQDPHPLKKTKSAGLMQGFARRMSRRSSKRTCNDEAEQLCLPDDDEKETLATKGLDPRRIAWLQKRFVLRTQRASLSWGMSQWLRALDADRVEGLQRRVIRRMQQQLLWHCWETWRIHVRDAVEVRLEALRQKARIVFYRLYRTLLTRGWNAWRKYMAADLGVPNSAALAWRPNWTTANSMSQDRALQIFRRQKQLQTFRKAAKAKAKAEASAVASSAVAVGSKAMSKMSKTRMLLKRQTSALLIADRVAAGAAGGDESEMGNGPWLRMVSGAANGIQFGVASFDRLLSTGTERARAQVANRFNLLCSASPASAVRTLGAMVDSKMTSANGLPAWASLLGSNLSPADANAADQQAGNSSPSLPPTSPAAETAKGKASKPAGPPPPKVSAGKRLLLSILKGNAQVVVALVNSLLQSSFVHRIVVAAIEGWLQGLHYEPMPLAEEGLLANYLLTQATPDLKHSVRNMQVLLNMSVSKAVSTEKGLEKHEKKDEKTDGSSPSGASPLTVPPPSASPVASPRVGAMPSSVEAELVSERLSPSLEPSGGDASPPAKPFVVGNYFDRMLNAVEATTGMDLNGDGVVARATNGDEGEAEPPLEVLSSRGPAIIAAMATLGAFVSAIVASFLVSRLVALLLAAAFATVAFIALLVALMRRPFPPAPDDLDVMNTKPTDFYLQQTLPRRLAKMLIRYMPRWAKAALPWHKTWPLAPETFDPYEIRATRGGRATRPQRGLSSTTTS